MKQFGLLGKTLGHSYSPRLHQFFGDYEYALFEKQPEELEAFLKQGAFDGLNVTIPYKKTVIPFCAEMSDVAQRLGSVNTIVRRKDGTLVGHNTDYAGFDYMLRNSGIEVAEKKVLVLGSGGASATVCAVLKDRGAQSVVVISRKGKDNYQNLDRHRDASVIVNTTPVGMYPNNGETPLDLSAFSACQGVLDLIYNPAKTAFFLQAEKLGIPAFGGLPMLAAQGKESAEWFLKHPIADERVEQAVHTLSAEMKNLILIGMPGCGKSTVGRLVAKRLGRPFADADEVVEQKVGKPIPKIFKEVGEKGFRRLETQVLRDLCRRSSCVIATGGGCVTVPENQDLIRQNGLVIWLRRDWRKLPTKGRPLSKAENLEKMLRVREPLYREFCDRMVENRPNRDDTVAEIERIYYENQRD